MEYQMDQIQKQRDSEFCGEQYHQCKRTDDKHKNSVRKMTKPTTFRRIDLKSFSETIWIESEQRKQIKHNEQST